MTKQSITGSAIDRRNHWVNEIEKVSGDFEQDSMRIEKNLATEFEKAGVQSLLDQLRLCGDIPEWFSHDSSEEKLYSKYTDILLSMAFSYLGLTSLVLRERADVADVEVIAEGYSFVADAKAFRLSRTAKNQKDFKIEAMDRWKHGKRFAMVVCPVFQLPSRTSQIYNQATTRNVCIFTYSHLSLLLAFARSTDTSRGDQLLRSIFETVEALNPSKDATSYWQAVNRSILDFAPELRELWAAEKVIAADSVKIAKEAALTYLAKQRESILRLSHSEAIAELIKTSKIDNKIKVISAISDNGLMDIS